MGIKDLLRNDEKCISIFELLNKYGYLRTLIFDNYGNLFTLVSTDDRTVLKLLASYVETAIPVAIRYYDVLLVHKNSIINLEEFIETSYGKSIIN